MKRVIIESPYAGTAPKGSSERVAQTQENVDYLRACLRDSLLRGEAPYASHALYTQPGVLDDDIAEERMHGIHAGFAWGEVADLRVFYADRGVSSGMHYGLEAAAKLGQPVEYRYLGAPWSEHVPSAMAVDLSLERETLR